MEAHKASYSKRPASGKIQMQGQCCGTRNRVGLMAGMSGAAKFDMRHLLCQIKLCKKSLDCRQYNKMLEIFPSILEKIKKNA